MNAAPNPPTKSRPSTTGRPPAAEPVAAQTARGVLGVVGRKAVLTAVRPDQQTGDGRYPLAWLRITAPKGATPTAASWCRCGRDLFAAGHRQVLALIADHADHRDLCPLRSSQEERNAA